MPPALEFRQPLVGRRHELRELITAVRAGRSWLLTGPIGIGRKRLIREALELAAQPFVRVSGQLVLHQFLIRLAAALNCGGARKPTSAVLRLLVLDALRRTPQWSENVPLIVTAASRRDLGYVQRLLWDPREEIALEPLSRNDAQALLDHAVRHFDLESLAVEDFGRKVLAAAKGNPGQILAMCGTAALPQYRAGDYIKFVPLRMDMLSAFLP
jgi:predicted ATPase